MDDNNVKLDTPVEPTPAQAPTDVTPAAAPVAANEGLADTTASSITETVVAPVNDTFHLPEDKKAARKVKGIFNKKFIVLAVGILLLSGLAILMLSATRGETEEEAQTITPAATEVVAVEAIDATIKIIEGDLETSTDAKEWTAAAINDELANLSYVRTTAESRAALDFSDGSIVRLNKSTTVQLRTLSDESVAMTVLGGETYAYLGDDTGIDFEIGTTNDSFTTSDAIFRTINSEELEGVEVFEGETTSADDVTVTRGESFYVVNKEDAANEKKAVELNRASLLADEFLQWNVTQDKDGSGLLDDLTAPKITITSPTAETLDTEEKTIVVTGTVDDADATVTINEKAAELDAAGAFSMSVELKIGKNTIIIAAKDAANNNDVTTITVTRAEASTATDITMQASKGSTGINVSWEIKDGVSAPDGYKVVYGEKTKPSYKSTDVKSQQTDDEITVLPRKDGKVYFIRVCIFNKSADTCANYSNEVKVTAPSS